jgi:hypothetical protein
MGMARWRSDIADGSISMETAQLTLVTDQSAVNGSRIIIREILQSFRRISLEGLWNDDCHLKAIARRWSCLCHEAEEITASRRLNTKLLGLAQVGFIIIPDQPMTHTV